MLPNTTPLAGVSRAAMLVDLNISTFSGRRQDRSTQEEITESKGAKSKRAASVSKMLFAECTELEAITKFQSMVRQRHYALTLPWLDSGVRLLPTARLLAYQQEMTGYQNTLHDLVDVFVEKYDVLVSAAAFQLGGLFDRADYPTKEQARKRFSITTTFMPLPTSGDFRLDIEADVQNDMRQRYEQAAANMLATAQADAWQRLYDVLTRISTRLTDVDGKRQRIYDTVLTNASDLCELLSAFNVTGDPALEHARARLHDALLGVEPADIRESANVRADVKSQVDAILADHDWSLKGV